MHLYIISKKKNKIVTDKVVAGIVKIQLLTLVSNLTDSNVSNHNEFLLINY